VKVYKTKVKGLGERVMDEYTVIGSATQKDDIQ